MRIDELRKDVVKYFDLDKMTKKEFEIFLRNFFERQHIKDNIHSYNEAVKLLNKKFLDGFITERELELQTEYEGIFWFMKK